MNGSNSYDLPGVFSSVASMFTSATGKRKKNPASVKNSSPLKDEGCGCLSGLQKTIKKQFQKCWKPNTVNVMPASIRAQQHWQWQQEKSLTTPSRLSSPFDSSSTRGIEEEISEEQISLPTAYTSTPEPKRTLRQQYLHNKDNTPNASGTPPLSPGIPSSSIIYRPANQRLKSTTHEIESVHSDTSTPAHTPPLSPGIPSSSIVYQPANQRLGSTTHEIESVHSDQSTPIQSAGHWPKFSPELVIELRNDLEIGIKRFRAFDSGNDEADYLLRQYAGSLNKYKSLCSALETLEKARKKEKISCFSFTSQKPQSIRQQKLEAQRQKITGKLTAQRHKLHKLLIGLDKLAAFAFQEEKFPFLCHPEKIAEEKARISYLREKAAADLARPKDIKKMSTFIKRLKDAELIAKRRKHPAIGRNRDFVERMKDVRGEWQEDIDAQIAMCPEEALSQHLTGLVEKELHRYIDCLDQLPILLDDTLKCIEENKVHRRRIRERLNLENVHNMRNDQSTTRRLARQVPAAAISPVRTDFSPEHIATEITNTKDKLEWIEKLKNEAQEQESRYRKQWIDLKLQKMDLKLPECPISSEDTTLREKEIKDKLNEVKPKLQQSRNHFYYLGKLEKGIRDRDAQSQQYSAESAAQIRPQKARLSEFFAQPPE